MNCYALAAKATVDHTGSSGAGICLPVPSQIEAQWRGKVFSEEGKL